MIQGLDLLDTLAEDAHDIYTVFGMSNNIPSSIDDLENGIFDCDHQSYIKVWILGKLAEYNTDWIKHLTKLDLINNQLTVLPESIGKLTNLTQLDLERNQLTTLPDSIENLPILKHYICVSIN